MSTPVASREAAYRIALAARALEGLDVRGLVTALADKFELPITESKLSQLTVEDLRVIIAGDHADENCVVGVSPEKLKEAVRILWGESLEGSEKPVAEAYSDGDMPNSIRVAVCSNKGEELDGHFGSCENFLIYQLSPTDIKLVDVRSGLDADAAEDKNVARAALIQDCQIVFLQSIGGPAAAKVVRAGVHPIKKPRRGPARDALVQLQGALGNPPPWLARIMGVEASSISKYAEDLEEDTEEA